MNSTDCEFPSEVTKASGRSQQKNRRDGSTTPFPVPKSKISSHLAKHKGRSIAIVLAIVGGKQRRVSGDDRCWIVLAAPALWERLILIL